MTTTIPGIYRTVLVLLAGNLAAQEPPNIPKGYATDGRKAAISQFQTAPGFVDVSSLDLLPWENQQGAAPGMKSKVLSRDEQRGAVALLTSVPIGWTDKERGYHTASEDIFLLEGDLTIDNQRLLKYSYTFIPGGVAHGPSSSRQGAVFLEWFNQTPDFVKSGTNAPGARTYAAVRDWNYYRVPWTTDFPRFTKNPPAPGPRLKLLRHDPDTGEMFWINAAIQLRQGLLWEVHPTFEEHFLLEYYGEMKVGECLPTGPVAMTWPAQSYHYRPAGIPHMGPIARRTGFGLLLCHTGGQLWADYYSDCSKRQPASAPH